MHDGGYDPENFEFIFIAKRDVRVIVALRSEDRFAGVAQIESFAYKLPVDRGNDDLPVSGREAAINDQHIPVMNAGFSIDEPEARTKKVAAGVRMQRSSKDSVCSM